LLYFIGLAGHLASNAYQCGKRGALGRLAFELLDFVVNTLCGAQPVVLTATCFVEGSIALARTIERLDRCTQIAVRDHGGIHVGGKADKYQIPEHLGRRAPALPVPSSFTRFVLLPDLLVNHALAMAVILHVQQMRDRRSQAKLIDRRTSP